MRLHSLTLQAFGPFPGTEHVDFDSLTEAGLFLLHGATGAGKTTVLDAVCFALYGVVPGARQRSQRLRSDHAELSLRTSVVLEATLRGRRLRLTRSPGWERPKRRGTGTTKEQPKALVEELTPNGARVLSTRLDEAGQLVRDLMGMSPDQFCQVVLLPQGQFADFLRADADARRPLLENLFGTARFSWVERWLVERRRDAWRELESGSAEVTAVVSRVREIAQADTGPDDPDGESATDPELLRRWVEELAAGSRVGCDAARVAAERAQAEFTLTCAADEAARKHLAALRRRGEVRARADALEAAVAERHAAAAQLDAAQRAAPVAPVVAAVQAARQRLDSARTGHRTAVRALDRLEAVEVTALLPRSARRAAGGLGADAYAGIPAEELRQLAAATLAELGALDELSRLEREVSDVDAQLAELGASSKAASAGARRLAARLDDAPRLRQELVAALDSARAADAALPGALAALDALTARLDAARRCTRLAVEVATAEAEAATAVDEAQCAREHWLDLRQRRLDGMAAELAARLVDGEPCPVCGGAEHPFPAHASDAVDEHDETAAEQRCLVLDAVRESASRRLADVRARLDAARVEAGEGDGESLAAEAAEQRRRVDAITRTAASFGSAATALESYDVELAGLQETRRATERELAGTKARLDALVARRATVLARLEEALGEDASASARKRRLRHLARACTEAAEAAESLHRAAEALTDAERDASLHVASAGFDSVEEVALAWLAPPEAKALQAKTDRWRAEEAAVAELLADPELATSAGEGVTDREVEVQAAAAQAALDAARRRLTAAAGDLREAETRADRLEALTVELAHRLDEIRPVRERYVAVDSLSRLADGSSADNALRMRLSAYVLAARLEQVAVAASERLVRMSGGRYTLEHTDLVAGGRSRSGLGLLVRDEWTGVARETTTLSGGESFFASLALALGLADVVAAEAGGAPIETLFVDEGFGSLDEETLDEVMEVLDGLREGGRAVGIVSHVADLRTRVPVQLHVRKGRRGSALGTGEGARGAA